MRTLISFLALVGTAHAIPTQLGHQGRLLDGDGLPLEGVHTLEFQLYDALEDGTVLWSEVYDIELDNGYYSLVLGADELGNPLEDTVLAEDTLYLELTIDDDEELSPRQALNAVPYARLASTATNVSGGIVDASELRVGGVVVVDGSGGWVSSTPSVDWSELTGVPEGFADDDDAVLSESEVDAYVDNNGYASSSDLADGIASVSYEALTDLPAALASGSVGIQAEYFTEDGSFVVPEGISSLMVYVTGGGGGGSNGEVTELDLGSHDHGVEDHSHAGGASHSHSAGEHTHAGGEHTHPGYCVSTSGYGGCSVSTPTTSSASVSIGAGSGTSGAADIGTTATTTLTTNTTLLEGGSVSTAGGDGGAGGGVSALVSIDAPSCEVSIGLGGDVAGVGTGTTVSCGDVVISCTGGQSGGSDGVLGADGLCTVTDGTVLTQFKASRGAPGGGGAGGRVTGSSAGQSGSVTIRY